MEGYPFTWERSRGTPWWVEEKLDRGLASQSWHDIFPATYITNEDASPSNHSTIILCTEGSTTTRRYRFRFENAWLCDDDCTALILQSWNKPGISGAQERVRNCATVLEAWGRERRHQFQNQLTSCRGRIRGLKHQRDADSVSQLKETRQKLNGLLAQQEAYWRPWAKKFWLASGDRSTCYFHRSASTRKRTNDISQLKDDNVNWCTWNIGLQQLILITSPIFSQPWVVAVTGF